MERLESQRVRWRDAGGQEEGVAGMIPTTGG